jgi:rsbT co-antagonist protein RsbR
MIADEMTKTTREDEVAALQRRVEELERAAAKLDALCAALEDLVFIVDNEGRYVDLFVTAVAPPEAVPTIVGKHMLDIFPPELTERLLEGLRRALATGQVVTLEYTGPTPEGERWYSGKISRLTETTVIWRARDITVARELVQAQEELRGFVRELSTPLVPLANGVIAMPLIGMIDQARAQEVTQNLLEGIVKYKAHTAILDLTGVRMVDAEVARALVGSAQAARFLGARLILTGISPDMAQALVELDADLSGIVTRGDLQAGIALAIELRAGRGAGARRTS